jgi:hypothetical protein
VALEARKLGPISINVPITRNRPENSRRDARNKIPEPKVVVFMKKIFVFGAAFAISGMLGAQFIQPASLVRQPWVRQSDSPAPILVGSSVDPHVLDPGAELPELPFTEHRMAGLYSRIFPFSWMIEHDVQAARTQMNLSRWKIYDAGEKSLLLSEIGSVVRNHVMPPRRYTIVHPEAKLSDAEAAEI